MHSPVKGQNAASLSRITDNVHRELASLAEECDTMQGLFSGLLMSSVLTNDTMMALQSLDHITQRLAGVGQFLGQLSRQMDSQWQVDPAPATKEVMLSDLATRLAAAPPEADAA